MESVWCLLVIWPQQTDARASANSVDKHKQFVHKTDSSRAITRTYTQVNVSCCLTPLAHFTNVV